MSYEYKQNRIVEPHTLVSFAALWCQTPFSKQYIQTMGSHWEVRPTDISLAFVFVFVSSPVLAGTVAVGFWFYEIRVRLTAYKIGLSTIIDQRKQIHV